MCFLRSGDLHALQNKLVKWSSLGMGEYPICNRSRVVREMQNIKHNGLQGRQHVMVTTIVIQCKQIPILRKPSVQVSTYFGLPELKKERERKIRYTLEPYKKYC